MGAIRMTYSTAAVLHALDAGRRYGFEISQATGLRRGTVYPILRRLEDAGLVSSRWEEPEDARAQGRPPRKYYELEPASRPVLERARDRYPLPELDLSGSTAGSSS
ncbi:MAG: PadR family transcriptional regulator [Acidobacteriota bacterium]